MSNRIEIYLDPLCKFKLVVEQNSDPNYDKEVFIGVEDKDGVWCQDLAVVRNAYTYDDHLNVWWKEDEFEVLVWGDKDDEDFTQKFTIGLYKEEQNEVWDQTY